jgi:hypothetical protein
MQRIVDLELQESLHGLTCFSHAWKQQMGLLQL